MRGERCRTDSSLLLVKSLTCASSRASAQKAIQSSLEEADRQSIICGSSARASTM